MAKQKMELPLSTREERHAELVAARMQARVEEADRRAREYEAGLDPRQRGDLVPASLVVN